MTATVPRDTERHPREAPIPAGADPSGNASANDIPDVEIEEPAAAPRENVEDIPDQTSGPWSSSTVAPPAAAPSAPDAQAPDRKVKSTRRRWPDTTPRFPQPELSHDRGKTDWSIFK